MAAPSLMERCSHILRSYLVSERLHRIAATNSGRTGGDASLPRYRTDEVAFILRELTTLEMHPQVSRVLFDNGNVPSITITAPSSSSSQFISPTPTPAIAPLLTLPLKSSSSSTSPLPPIAGGVAATRSGLPLPAEEAFFFAGAPKSASPTSAAAGGSSSLLSTPSTSTAALSPLHRRAISYALTNGGNSPAVPLVLEGVAAEGILDPTPVAGGGGVGPSTHATITQSALDGHAHRVGVHGHLLKLFPVLCDCIRYTFFPSSLPSHIEYVHLFVSCFCSIREHDLRDQLCELFHFVSRELSLE
jgi:hypothetical protein